MAAPNYAVPSWVKGADPIGKRLQAYSIGLQAAQAAARLAIERQHLQHQANQMAQDAQLAQMRLNIAQQEQQRKEAHDAQQIEVLKEYHRQQGDLRQLQLSQEEQKIKFQSDAAAQKASAVMRMQARIAAGEDPTKVALEEGPALGPIFSNALRVSRMPKAIVPGESIKAGLYTDPITGDPIEGYRNVPSSSGTGTHAIKIGSEGKSEPLASPQSLAILKKALGYNATPDQKKTLQDLSDAWMARQKKLAGLTPKEDALIPDWAALPGEEAPPESKPVLKKSVGLPDKGTVVGGYRFLGGDPADQSNWDSVIREEDALLPGEQSNADQAIQEEGALLPGEE